MKFRFDDSKATQAAAMLLKQEDGGEMNNYLFIKMLYLADRESMRRWSEPITGDQGSSMKHGPVLSHIYDLTKGKYREQEWCRCISLADTDSDFVISLKEDPGSSLLTPSEIQILKEIWTRFNKFTFGQMKRYSHALAEYDKSVEEINTSRPIESETLLRAVGKSPDDIQEAASMHHEIEIMNALFG